MTEVLIRKCWICKIEKPLSEFYKDKKDCLGFQKRCKQCNKDVNRKYKENNPEYFKIKGKEFYHSKDTKAYNKERYNKHRDRFLSRRDAYAATISGRFNILLYSAKTRADKNNLEYDIDLDWLCECYKNQGEVCYLTKIPFDLSTKPTSGTKHSPFSPSLHRKDSNKGYTKENTLLVITAINLAMNAFGDEVFLTVINNYLENYKPEWVVQEDWDY